MRFWVMIVTVLALAAPASAGGASHAYEVRTFQRDGATRAEIVLQAAAVDAGHGLAPCQEIALSAAYRPEFFLARTWSRHISRADHQTALDALQSAHDAGSIVRLAILSEVDRDAAGRCVLSARGLERTPDDQIVAYDQPI